MSRPFNDTDNLTGLVQKYEEEIGAPYGYVSGDTTRLKAFASATRSTWDRYLTIAFKASGKWQYDDTNHVDGSGNYTYPVIRTNLADGQRDYTFTTDEGGALVLDVLKVAILPSATATEYEEIYPVDAQSESDAQDILAESTNEGTPVRYDKMANGIFLDPIPSYNATNGLKVYINREPSYFTYQDTTKRPGCPGNHHDYFFLRPALEYARINNLPNYDRLLLEVRKFEGDETQGLVGTIERDFSRRAKDDRNIMKPKRTLYI